MFTYVDADNEENDKALEFFEIEDEDDMPIYMIFNMDKNARWRSDNKAEVTKEKVSEFCKKFREGKLPRTLKSQPVPKDWDKRPVKVNNKTLSKLS